MESEVIAMKYLDAFQNQNIDELGAFFSSSVKLRDWEQTANGIDAVLEANAKIFSSFEKIHVEILNIVKSVFQVAVEFNLDLISDSERFSLLVVDIIEFDKDMKISAVRAYKGN
jgi:hypothetical protein